MLPWARFFFLNPVFRFRHFRESQATSNTVPGTLGDTIHPFSLLSTSYSDRLLTQRTHSFCKAGGPSSGDLVQGLAPSVTPILLSLPLSHNRPRSPLPRNTPILAFFKIKGKERCASSFSFTSTTSWGSLSSLPSFLKGRLYFPLAASPPPAPSCSPQGRPAVKTEVFGSYLPMFLKDPPRPGAAQLPGGLLTRGLGWGSGQTSQFRGAPGTHSPARLSCWPLSCGPSFPQTLGGCHFQRQNWKTGFDL